MTQATTPTATVAATATAKRVRRTPEEARTARVERERILAEKAITRQAKFAALAEKAAGRAKIASERQERFEHSETVHRERVEEPALQESTTKRVTRELAKFVKDLGERNGMSFDVIAPRLTRRGAALSIRISGHAAMTKVVVKQIAGATREATRFMENYKLIGVKPNMLGKEVQLAGEGGKFKVMGLKGRTHDVILQKVDHEGETLQLPAADFKARVVSV